MRDETGLRPREEQKLWVLAGAAGSGKSSLLPKLLSLARQAEEPMAPLDPDLWFGPMERALMSAAGHSPDDRDSPEFKSLARPARYDGFWSGARLIWDSGMSILMVAPFTQEIRDKTIWARAAEQLPGARASVVWLTASPARRKERIIARARREDQAKLADWEGYLRRAYDPQMDPNCDARLRLVSNENETPQQAALKVFEAFRER